MGRVREEKRRRKKIKNEKVKKIQVREKVGKSRNTVFFQYSEAPEGRKVGSLKWRVRSHVVRGEMKSCTPLWREAHVQVKMDKAPRVRSTFGSLDVEKVHAVVVRRCAKHISKSKVQKKLRGSEHFWTFRYRSAWHGQGMVHVVKSEQL